MSRGSSKSIDSALLTFTNERPNVGFIDFLSLVQDALQSHCGLVLKALLEMESRLAAVSAEINLFFRILVLNFSHFFKILTEY